MIIKQAQMSALGLTRRAEYEKRTAAVLAKPFAKRAGSHSPETWRKLVHDVIEQALQYGLTRGEDVMTFAIYALASSEDPYAMILPAWFRQIMEDRVTQPDERLAAISIACGPADQLREDGL